VRAFLEDQVYESPQEACPLRWIYRGQYEPRCRSYGCDWYARISGFPGDVDDVEEKVTNELVWSFDTYLSDKISYVTVETIEPVEHT